MNKRTAANQYRITAGQEPLASGHTPPARNPGPVVQMPIQAGKTEYMLNILSAKLSQRDATIGELRRQVAALRKDRRADLVAGVLIGCGAMAIFLLSADMNGWPL